MTVHSAKGLEFPIVFITGLEDGLFPISNSFDDPKKMEEERRLFYVAITRAMKNLFLSYSTFRFRWGQYIDCSESRFLKDGTQENLRIIDRIFIRDGKIFRVNQWDAEME